MEYVVLILFIIIVGYLYYLNTPTGKGITLEWIGYNKLDRIRIDMLKSN